MKRARKWIVLIGAGPEITRTVGKTLQAAGYTYTHFPNAASFLASEHRRLPACLVVDIDPDKLSQGLSMLRELMRDPICCPAVVLNVRGELPPAVSALRLYCFEFLQGRYTSRVLLGAIRRAKRFKAYRGHDEHVTPQHQLLEQLATLTRRELEITGEMLYGRSSKEIADRLGISVRTVDAHRTRVFRKMQVRSVGNLVRLYINSR